MKERPIIFSAPMIRAIQDGRKTQTRRIVKPQPEGHRINVEVCGDQLMVCFNEHEKGEPCEYAPFARCPYGQPGELLWVRENGWERPHRTAKMMREGANTWKPYYYDADSLSRWDVEEFKEWGFKRRPSIHMPRWASRITLEVTDVRVQRLQEISEADARAEGCLSDADYLRELSHIRGADAARALPSRLRSARDEFHSLWNDIHGFGAWAANPWVRAISFRRVDPAGKPIGGAL